MKNWLVILLIIINIIWPVYAHSEMTSTDYIIFADSIDTGGALSTGGTFSLEDTIGESPIGTVTGGVYIVRGGYQSMSSSSISMSVSSTTLNLGTLSTSAVTVSSTTSTITTDSEGGYTLSIGTVSGTSIAAVVDGSVTAGQEEYGITATGMDSQLSTDVAIANSLIISSSSTPATNADTQILFKASINNTSVAGSYSQTVPLIASVNL